MVKTVESEKAYAANDGTEFDRKADAEQYEKLHSAREEYANARKHYARMLAESFKTADGRPFDFSVWHYCRVSPWLDLMPCVEEVSISRYDFDFSQYVGGKVAVTDVKFQCRVPGRDKPMFVKIGDLYYRREAAEIACVAARRERIREHIEATDEMEAKLGGSP